MQGLAGRAPLVRVVRARPGDLRQDGGAWLGPPPRAHQARARARRGRREGLRPRGRAAGARGGRLHDRLRRRLEHRRDRGRLARARAATPRSIEARACARPSRPRPSPRRSRSRSRGQATGLDAMIALLREHRRRAHLRRHEIPLAIMTADLTTRVPAPIRDGPAVGGADGRHRAGRHVPAARARRAPPGRRPRARPRAHAAR